MVVSVSGVRMSARMGVNNARQNSGLNAGKDVLRMITTIATATGSAMVSAYLVMKNAAQPTQ